MQTRPLPLLYLLTALLAVGSVAFVEINPVRQLIQQQTLADSLPAPKLPAGADPNDPDWQGVDLAPKAPVQPLSPADEARHFLLPPGYQIEPVLTEPAIQQPAEIHFDADGRMFVLELRTYMLDADSRGELAPTSRISRWEDRNNDGIYETGTTFVDSLVFPRFVLPYGKNCILTMESDADIIYKYTDTNNDGRADKKEFFTNKYGRSGNVEHQQAFLHWGMDNWLYSTVNAFRIRQTPHTPGTPASIVREKTGANRAQWGLCHDDEGKLWFQGGASGLPSYFQFPIHYGNIDVPNEFEKGFDVPWGAPIQLADMQGGMDQVRQPDGSLNRVTGAAGNDIYRGDRLPAALRGQYFYGEPVARIVRQVNPVVTEGLTTLHNVYQAQQSEFLRSTDPLFRPVDMTTAPDGSLYITDMYRGIIQEGQWTQKGTYLRTKIEQYGLDKVVGLGRIWRITYKGIERDKTRPAMYAAPAGTLVRHLAHPNGWWRDAAQQELVQRNDRSAVPALATMLRTHPNPLARTHALWTLEGMGALTAPQVQTLLKNPNPKLRIQALRAGETLYKSVDKSLETNFSQALADPDTDVRIQAMLTASLLKLPDWENGLKTAMATNPAAGVKRVGEQLLNPPKARTGGPFGGAELTASQKTSLERGTLIYNELCSQCHGNTGMGTPAGNGKLLAPALAGSGRMQAHPDYAIRVVLHGLEGAIEGKTYAGGLMASMKDQTDEWIADVLSYVRTGLPNEASLVTPAQVAAVRAKTTTQPKAYGYAQLASEIPVELPAQTLKATASHTTPTRIGGNAAAASAFTYEGWSSGGRQQAGMWYQLELPRPTHLTELHFAATSIRKPSWKPAPGKPAWPAPMVSTHPRTYAVEASADGQQWQTVKTNVQGSGGDNIVSIDVPNARYLRLRLTELPTEPDEIPWMMRQLKLFARQTPQIP
jgi:putative membrane-bound dehydrogenase-like protein